MLIMREEQTQFRRIYVSTMSISGNESIEFLI